MKIYAYSLLYPAAANKTSLTDVLAHCKCIVGGAYCVENFNLKARCSMNIIHGLPELQKLKLTIKGKGDNTR